jgi:bacteriorhodopsin
MVTLSQESLDGNGRVVLWVTFGLMSSSAIAFTAMAARKPMHLRSHACVTTAIVTIAALAYYAMATNSGNSPIPVENNRGVSRSIFWARYIDWFMTTPLLLLDVLLLAGTPFGTCLWIIFCDIAMIVLGLFGAVTTTKFKWGWYGISCMFQLLITYGLLVPALKSATLRGPKLRMLYIGFAAYLCILWLGYPIVWGLAEGSNTITSDAEAASYAGLDIATKIIFGWGIMLCTPMAHKELQLDHDEKKGLGRADPMSTPINNLWGTSSSVPANTATMRPAAAGNAASTGYTPPNAEDGAQRTEATGVHVV